MKFEDIKTQAIAEWEALEQGGVPIIRIGAATSDRATGALEVIAAFESELARLNVEARIVTTGSIGFSNHEPLVIISKPDYPRICYGKVTPDMVVRAWWKAIWSKTTRAWSLRWGPSKETEAAAKPPTFPN